MRVIAVITCHIGPKAVMTLSAAGIKVYARQQGTIKELVKKFQEGNMKSTLDPLPVVSSAAGKAWDGVGVVAAASGMAVLCKSDSVPILFISDRKRLPQTIIKIY